MEAPLTSAEPGRTAFPRVPGDERGHALLMVLVLIVGASLAVAGLEFAAVMEERAAGAAAERARLAAAAGAVVAEMQERLIARAQSVNGALWAPDLATLNAQVLGLAVPAGMSLDFGRTGYRVIEQRQNEVIPADEEPVAAWTDQPRLSYDGVAPAGGLVAARTLVVAVYATVRTSQGASYTVRRDFAVSQVPPHQHALYVAGDAAACAWGGGEAWIGGPVRVEGTLTAGMCADLFRLTGGVEARDGISAGAGASTLVAGADGESPLGEIPRDGSEAGAASWLPRWGGRVRLSAGVGGPLALTRFNTPSVAGMGECAEVADPGGLACGGRARYYPAVQLRRVTPGGGAEYAVSCGEAYAGAGCPDLRAAITYVPWPFAGPQAAGQASVDPAAAPYPWRGLFFDAERETRCTATVAGNTFRTARCATNAYGFRIDVGVLPAVQGGLLSIRRAAGQAPGANDSGAQEVVLLTDASALAGPLTIHSELPVFIAGSFNTRFVPAWNGPPPAMIQAPRIVLLPNEAAAQLQTSAVWDSVPPAGAAEPLALPLRAESNVTVYAVLRTRFCPAAGASSAGLWQSAPALLGDWSGAAVRIVGAVESEPADPASPICLPYARAAGAAPPSGTGTVAARSRMLLYDDRLLHPLFQPPGSWTFANVPPSGPSAIASRPPVRQFRATGGTSVVRRIHAEQSGSAVIPDEVTITPHGPVPAAPPPLP